VILLKVTKGFVGHVGTNGKRKLHPVPYETIGKKIKAVLIIRVSGVDKVTN